MNPGVFPGSQVFGCPWTASLSVPLKASARGAPPDAPDVPGQPNVQSHSGGAAPIWTYQDLLGNAHDEALFEYFFTTQVGTIDLATGRRTAIGSDGERHATSIVPSPRSRSSS